MWIFSIVLLSAIALMSAVFALRLLRKYAQRTIAFIRILRSHIRDASAGIKMLEFYSKPAVKEHLTALRNPTGNSTGVFAISYGLARITDQIKPAFIGPENDGTVVCTVAIGTEFRKRVELCLDSHRNFASGRNITLCVLDEPPPYMGRPPAWMKIPLIAKLLLAGYKRILFIDADAMVTNPDFRIEDIFEELENTNRPILVTEDEDGINSGVMLIQNISAAYRLLDLIWLNDSDIHNGTWEQNSLKVLMDASNEIRSLVAIESKPKTINSFPVERRLFHPTRTDQIWSLGDFICHFSGLRSPHLERYISNYATSLRKNAAYLPALAQPLIARQD